MISNKNVNLSSAGASIVIKRTNPVRYSAIYIGSNDLCFTAVNSSISKHRFK
jgi:hypothetical protein